VSKDRRQAEDHELLDKHETSYHDFVSCHIKVLGPVLHQRTCEGSVRAATHTQPSTNFFYISLIHLKCLGVPLLVLLADGDRGLKRGAWSFERMTKGARC
jgi:hypothetical protein